MKTTTAKMYLASDSTIASEMNYLLFTDGNGKWYSVVGSRIGELTIDGSDCDSDTDNEIIADALREAISGGEIVSIRDFVIDAISNGSEIASYQGKTIEDIDRENNYHEDLDSGDILPNENGCHEYYWPIAEEKLEWDEDGDLV